MALRKQVLDPIMNKTGMKEPSRIDWFAKFHERLIDERTKISNYYKFVNLGIVGLDDAS